jgi:hypothetical protein
MLEVGEIILMVGTLAFISMLGAFGLREKRRRERRQ